MNLLSYTSKKSKSIQLIMFYDSCLNLIFPIKNFYNKRFFLSPRIMVAMQLIGTKIRSCLIEGQASQVLNFPISLHTIFSCGGGGGEEASNISPIGDLPNLLEVKFWLLDRNLCKIQIFEIEFGKHPRFSPRIT